MKSKKQPPPARKPSTHTKPAVPVVSQTEKPLKTKSPEESPEKAPLTPVVGIGASAGGLEALTNLFQNLPSDTGMAFVIVQHLDPKHESMLSELVGKVAKMPVSQVTDGVSIAPDRVYVIPPGQNMGILRGKLHLVPVEKVRGQHMPIDYFFASLAEDHGSNCIGVVLSGSAYDGTKGVKLIKAEGGIVFAQDEKSSKYFSMPSSAIETGCVDFVLPPEAIADELVKISKHPYLSRPAGGKAFEIIAADAALNKIFVRLRDASGVDFSFYKKSTVLRRIKRRMALHRLEKMEHYLKYLQENNAEAKALYQDILISVTSFFRDPGSFQALREKIFPSILSSRKNSEPVRIWVPGCATGEEAYSIAISLMETLGEEASTAYVQLFATDIDEKALEKARAATYSEHISTEVAPELLKKYFLKVEGAYRVSKTVRDMCVFARQNVFKDPPFSRLDLISCRNLLIYLEQEMQKKVLSIFHYGLKPTGFLMLGSSESVGSSADLFSVVDRKFKVYSKKSIRMKPVIDLAFSPARQDTGAVEKREGRETWVGQDVKYDIDRIIVEKYGPAGVVVNEDMQIMQFHGRTDPYLEHRPGSADLNLMKMVREGMLHDLRDALEESNKEGRQARREGVRLRRDGEVKEIDIEIMPFKQISSRDRYFLVLFHEAKREKEVKGSKVKRKKAGKPGEQETEITELKQELTATREYLQSIINGREAANEDLKSANEEILSSNEELQSTNEELETAKEELQSTNEELATVNEELENRNNELTQANNDLLNLFSSVDIPIVILDADSFIRRFTPAAERVLNLIHSDIGRPIGHIKPRVDVPDLEELTKKVIEKGRREEREVRDSEGRFYSMRISPYRTAFKNIEGAVLLFLEITALRRSQDEAIASRSSVKELIERLAVIMRDSNDAIFAYGPDGVILFWNRGAESIYGYTEAEAVGMNVSVLAPDGALSQGGIFSRLLKGEEVRSLKAGYVSKNGRVVQVFLTATLLAEGEKGQGYVILTAHEIPVS
ncbi:Chemotaxis protein methyltransferase [uncultured bacterium]|nr:Chemotaxis protein methyltransferase [uncultured bacterium]